MIIAFINNFSTFRRINQTREFCTMTLLSFHPVHNPKSLISILNEKKPQSCCVYNEVILYENFKQYLQFHILGEDINSETWIAVIYNREDWGSFVMVSAPKRIADGTSQIPPKVKEAFINATMLDWNTTFVFMALTKPVSAMLIDISVNVKGNKTAVHPCILFYMDPTEVENIKISPKPGMEIRSLQEQDSEFLVNTWEYSKNGTDTVVRKSIRGAGSAGIFTEGKCVSGVITPGHGLISMLYTLKEYRGRGLGKATMQYVFQENVRRGCIPCSIVETQNKGSILLHRSLGVKQACVGDSIIVKGCD